VSFRATFLARLSRQGTAVLDLTLVTPVATVQHNHPRAHGALDKAGFHAPNVVHNTRSRPGRAPSREPSPQRFGIVWRPAASTPLASLQPGTA